MIDVYSLLAYKKVTKKDQKIEKNKYIRIHTPAMREYEDWEKVPQEYVLSYCF